jgi:hypothetical protein
MIVQEFFNRAALVAALILALGAPSNILLAAGGDPVHYVDALNGSDAAGDGSAGNPWKSITHAMGENKVKTLVIGSGNYDEANGELFPIQLPNKFIRIEGPGDGSATVGSPTLVGSVIESGSLASQIIDGLRVEGSIADSDEPLIRVNQVFQMHITNNELVGGNQGIHGVLFRDDIGIVIRDNSISSQLDDGIYLRGQAAMGLDVFIYGNTISGTGGDGMQVVLLASDEGHEVSGSILVDHNTVSGAGDEGIQIDLSLTGASSQVLNAVVAIRGSTVTGVDSDAIAISCFNQSASANEATVSALIGGNTLAGNHDDAIDMGVFMESGNNTLTLNASVVNNTASGNDDDGLDLEFAVSGSSSALDADFLIRGNTLSENLQSGVDLSAWIESSSNISADIDIQVLNNEMQGNDYGLELENCNPVMAGAGSMDFALTVRENTIGANGTAGVLLDLFENSSSYVAGASYTATYDFSFGNNTIAGNALGGYEIELGDVPAALLSSVDMMENFWGTQNSLLITGRTWDGLDDPLLAMLDCSLPRPDELAFAVDATPDQVVLTADPDGTYFVPFAGNLMDGTGAALVVTVAGVPVPAKYVNVASGVITISPVPSRMSDSAAVCVTNPGGQSGCGQINGGLGDPNTAPVAIYDQADTPNGTAVMIDVVANDTDAEDNLDPTTVTITQAPDHGTAVNNGDGTVTYTPNAGPNTSDTFNYTVADIEGLASNIATVEVQTTGAGSGGGGDNTAPTALSDQVETPNGTAVVIDVVANDTDDEGNLDPTTVTITQDPGQGTALNNGDGTVTYTPNAGSNTSDTFNYTVADTGGLVSNTATVQVQTTGDGSGGGGENTAPIAIYDAADTLNGAAVTIDVTANDTDAEANLDPTTVTITQAPHKGTAVNNGDGTVTYTPNPGDDTTDTFNYTVADTGGLVSNIATVEVRTTNGKNNIPTAVYDNVATAPDTQVGIDLLANDWDADNDALLPETIVVEQQPHGGTVTVSAAGIATYTPFAATSGRTDTFTYSVEDDRGGRSNIATVEVLVHPHVVGFR